MRPEKKKHLARLLSIRYMIKIAAGWTVY